MQIIPVLDLKDGVVVHAVRGNRDHYQAIQQHSCLTPSSDLKDVMAAFLNIYAFDSFYLADLNAITGTGNHNSQIAELLSLYPHLHFWIDNGSQLPEMPLKLAANYRPVIGTESQLSLPKPLTPDQVENLILSLDFKHQASGHRAWFDATDYWPNTVIVMTLARVGAKSGPDFAKLRQFSTKHPDKKFVAAGGIRHYADLTALSEIGIHSALMATALHDGSLSSQQINKLQAKKYPSKLGYF